MRGKSFLVPAIALTCLLGGIALVCVLPVPEDMAHAAISKIDVGPFDWNGIKARTAVADLNEELRKQGCTRYKVSFAEDAAAMESYMVDSLNVDPPVDAVISLKLDKSIPAMECIRYVAELSGCHFVPTREGVLMYSIQSTPLPPYRPSWRQVLRDWFKFGAPSLWHRITDGK